MHMHIHGIYTGKYVYICKYKYIGNFFLELARRSCYYIVNVP